MRLHLVTSRAPLAGSVASEDTVVLMDAARQEQVRALRKAIATAKPHAIHAIHEIGYPRLVALVAECNQVISW